MLVLLKKQNFNPALCFHCFETYERKEIGFQWFLRANRINEKKKFNDLWNGFENYSFMSELQKF
jgi:hypothetical protein